MIMLDDILNQLLSKEELTHPELELVTQLTIAVALTRIADYQEELISSLESVASAIEEQE